MRMDGIVSRAEFTPIFLFGILGVSDPNGVNPGWCALPVRIWGRIDSQ
jgi:hypothetical protein